MKFEITHLSHFALTQTNIWVEGSSMQPAKQEFCARWAWIQILSSLSANGKTWIYLLCHRRHFHRYSVLRSTCWLSTFSKLGTYSSTYCFQRQKSREQNWNNEYFNVSITRVLELEIVKLKVLQGVSHWNGGN